ncbi:MAG: SGNH/GDSL hydrolase family protein [Candidatus Omnitrophica bacterium]|nr:SGNH/GDSL hydrolase family protein [Candidatus Omnitrophota bacterium]MBU4477872.1 SGNH/GDSL hydrolase family protein [Candidatus Omnitrophota bacterium]MCG2704145.1 SGNH/GDSL hydrolase family protein [Candidatus Omnitrophota bacterium]
MFYFKFKGKRYCIKTGGILLLATVGLICGLLLGEVGVRMFVKIPLEKEYLRFGVFQYERIPERLIDKDVFWKRDCEFRGKIYSKEKPEDSIRVACLGDSCTEAPDLSVEQTYTYFLERKINSLLEGKKIEVMNCGVGGYSSLQALRYLKKEISLYHPDIVIAWVGIHDSTSAWFYEDKEQRMPPAGGDKSILEKSSLFLFLKNYQELSNNINSCLLRVSLMDSEKNCREIVAALREYNAYPVFIIPFSVGRKSNAVFYSYLGGYCGLLKELASTSQCTIIDLVPWLRSQDNLSELFLDVCHPSEKGNRMIANYIAENLLKLGILE